MGRRMKNPPLTILPVSSKKQLLKMDKVCEFLGGISHETLSRLRNDPAERFPPALQIFSQMPLWSVDQLERYVARKEKEVEGLDR